MDLVGPVKHMRWMSKELICHHVDVILQYMYLSKFKIKMKKVREAEYTSPIFENVA